jgi:hypothetical protein
MTTDQPQPKKRSKRLYLLWGIALTLLLTLGAFCWLVVVPVWRTRQVVSAYVGNEIDGKAAVEQLGGGSRASRAVQLYRRMPKWLAPERDNGLVIRLLGHCDKAGVRPLVILGACRRTKRFASGSPGCEF